MLTRQLARRLGSAWVSVELEDRPEIVPTHETAVAWLQSEAAAWGDDADAPFMFRDVLDEMNVDGGAADSFLSAMVGAAREELNALSYPEPLS